MKISHRKFQTAVRWVASSLLLGTIGWFSVVSGVVSGGCGSSIQVAADREKIEERLDPALDPNGAVASSSVANRSAADSGTRPPPAYRPPSLPPTIDHPSFIVMASPSFSSADADGDPATFSSFAVDGQVMSQVTGRPVAGEEVTGVQVRMVPDSSAGKTLRKMKHSSSGLVPVEIEVVRDVTDAEGQYLLVFREILCGDEIWIATAASNTVVLKLCEDGIPVAPPPDPPPPPPDPPSPDPEPPPEEPRQEPDPDPPPPEGTTTPPEETTTPPEEPASPLQEEPTTPPEGPVSPPPDEPIDTSPPPVADPDPVAETTPPAVVKTESPPDDVVPDESVPPAGSDEGTELVTVEPTPVVEDTPSDEPVSVEPVADETAPEDLVAEVTVTGDTIAEDVVLQPDDSVVLVVDLPSQDQTASDTLGDDPGAVTVTVSSTTEPAVGGLTAGDLVVTMDPHLIVAGVIGGSGDTTVTSLLKTPDSAITMGALYLRIWNREEATCVSYSPTGAKGSFIGFACQQKGTQKETKKSASPPATSVPKGTALGR